MLNKIYISIIIFILPVFAFAQTYLKNTDGILSKIKYIVTNILTPLVFVLAVMFFFWGVAKYIWSEGQGKAEGKQIMFWGVIALFVISSVWGIVKLLRTELNVGGDSSVPIPTIGGSGGDNTDYWDSQSP